MNKKIADVEVFQRLLKSADAAVFLAGAVFISTLSLTKSDAATPGKIGFLSLLLMFLILYVNRSLGLYRIEAMARAVVNMSKAWLVAAISGALLYKIALPMNLSLDANWLFKWSCLQRILDG